MSKTEQPSTNSGNQNPDTPDTPPIVIDIPDNKDPRTLSAVPVRSPHTFDTIPPDINLPPKGSAFSGEPAEAPEDKHPVAIDNANPATKP